MTPTTSDPETDEATTLRTCRLELDIDDLRAENARLKGSIAQRQNEIVRLGEHEVTLLAEIAELRRGLADTQAALAARAGVLWPVRAALHRIEAARSRRAG